MPFRRVSPRNDLSKRDNIVGANKVPIIKKRYPRQALSNADARANDRFSSVDSRFSSQTSVGWADR